MAKKNNNLFWLGAAAGALVAAGTLIRKQKAYSFKDKVVVITGGSRGIGLAIARLLADEGAKLAICSRTEHQVENAVEELVQKGVEVLAVTCDLTYQVQAQNFIQGVIDKFGRIDVLINNAGVIQAGPLDTMELEDYQQAMNIHFWAPLYTMLATIPHFKAAGKGRIVNIASIGGMVSIPHIVPYSASKFALVGLSEGFRSDLKKDNIVVTTVCPGLTRSGSNFNIEIKGQTEKEFAWFTAMGASLLTSSSVEHTAKQAINGCRYGEAVVITNVPAKILAATKFLMPELTADLMALTNNYILPDSNGNTEPATGFESDSDLIPEHLRKRAAREATENNEL